MIVVVIVLMPCGQTLFFPVLHNVKYHGEKNILEAKAFSIFETLSSSLSSVDL